MRKILDEISEEYRRVSKKFYGVSYDLPFGTVPENNGKPHIEIKKDGTIAYVGTDNGVETSRKETHSVDELMYWIFSSYANSRAFRNRGASNFRDSQNVALDEIGKVSDEWRERMKKEQKVGLKL